MSDSEIQPSKTFNDRMKDRVREGIGELLTDEEVEQIVKRAMHEVFFQPRTRTVGSGFHSREESVPPLAHEIVREQLEPLMRQCIEQWIADNKNEVHQIIKDVLERNTGEALIKGIASVFNREMTDLQMNIENRISNM